MEHTLRDVIDLDLLQQIQDRFALAMGMASITVDHEGPVTKPSNFTDFCMKKTRNTTSDLSLILSIMAIVSTQ